MVCKQKYFSFTQLHTILALLHYASSAPFLSPVLHNAKFFEVLPLSGARVQAGVCHTVA